jgi:DNA-binding PadR family transcriptional regulator
MSIRQGLLALLEDRPRYGYELRQEFESRTGSTWPLNVGQVYTTLARLERDGFVEPDHTDDEGHAYYRITPAGRVEVADWFARPVGRESQPRDELAIKLALAITLSGVDVAAMVQTQRAETMRALQEVTRLKARATDGPDDLAWTLVADAMVFQAEAEIRWLDHCEARLVRAAAVRAPREPDVVLPSTETRPAAAKR